MFHLKQNNKACAELDPLVTQESPVVSLSWLLIDQNLLLALMNQAHHDSVSNLGPAVNMKVKFQAGMAEIKVRTKWAGKNSLKDL